MNYQMGDIVWVTNLEEIKEAENHLFVVLDDDGKAIPADYFGFIVSSRLEKSKEVSGYKYNEPIQKNETNNLDEDSIVKCDQLYTIPKEGIQCKIGTVDYDDLNRFITSYGDFLSHV